ncbi:AraC family transcriptional regulator [Mucilaginibacter litoreus]|uniref:AraC family transcriptional regulator n=1 Tax=Mucilaginibacter litoreus TaxID=1048221 RepID=A0ABW3AQM8_9SPHI
MKVLPFTIPVPHDSTIIVQEDLLDDFYPHLHRHAEVQLTWVIKGEGTLIAGNSMHVFKQGDIFVFGANLPHVFKTSVDYLATAGNTPVHSLTVFFDPLGKLQPLFNLPEMNAVKQYFGTWQSGYKVKSAKLPAYQEYINKIVYSHGAERLSVFIGMLDTLIMADDIIPLSAITYNQPLSDPEGMRIAAVYNYIMNNYNSSITLEQVAAQAHLTPNAFCRYFKKHTRLTLIEFVNKIRVEQACKRLINGEFDNIAGVAYSCGFTSITNFNYVFRKIMGKTPRDYVNRFAEAIR